MMTVKPTMERVRIMCDAARELKRMQDQGHWTGISPSSAAETAMVLANEEPLTGRERAVLSEVFETK